MRQAAGPFRPVAIDRSLVGADLDDLLRDLDLRLDRLPAPAPGGSTGFTITCESCINCTSSCDCTLTGCLGIDAWR
jgi:hypothetical protein